MTRWTNWVSVALIALTVALLVVATRPTSTTRRIGRIPPVNWVVSVGDSYVSGQGGRWAGNSADPADTDALGPDAYEGGGCHRAASAQIHIGGGVPSTNLACSGARSATVGDTPGLDFAGTDGGTLGQALALQRFATGHHVRMVLVSVGGNDFGFASVATDCVRDFLTSVAVLKNYCHDDGDVTGRFTGDAVALAQERITTALGNVRLAMQRAGYAEGDYTVVVEDYPSPVPRGAGLRYGEEPTRQLRYGCGLWNGDLDWADDTALSTVNRTVQAAAAVNGMTVLDVSGLLDGHRLCEDGTSKLTASWRSPGAVDRAEWVQEIRLYTAGTGPYDVEESLHPNYFGQLALRDCVRQAYADGSPHGGTCTSSSTGLDAQGEPLTTLR